jgi:hypothetical protein
VAKLEGGTPTEMIRTPKRPRDLKGPGTYTQALTNIKIAIFKETYPEEKLTEDDQDSILEILGGVLRRTPKEELKSYRLMGGALIYACVDQQSGQWLIKATDDHRLESGARLKTNDTRNLPKPVALRTRDKAAQNQEELLKWIADLNPGLHTENSRVLDKQSESKGQRLILFIDHDSYTTIQRTGNEIYTGLSQGNVKVLNDPEVQHRAEPVSETNSVSEGDGDEIPFLRMTKVRRIRGVPHKEPNPKTRRDIKW